MPKNKAHELNVDGDFFQHNWCFSYSALFSSFLYILSSVRVDLDT